MTTILTPVSGTAVAVEPAVIAAALALVLLAAAALLAPRFLRRRVEKEKVVAVGRATATILHQIRNPLQSIMLHADLVAMVDQASPQTTEGIVEESVRESCRLIVAEAGRLAEMLDELALFVAGSPREISASHIPLHRLARQVADGERRQMAAAGVHCEVSIEEEVEVVADPYYLRQAVENLVRNAREILANGKGSTIRICVDRKGGSARLRVADDGPGMSPARQNEIFEPFVSHKVNGMGLGLPICREIVERHGGQVEVRSEEGKGTTFTIRIPLDR